MRNARIRAIVASEIAYILTQPVFWILLIVLGLLTLSLSPAVFIPSEPETGGEGVWINSRYALLQFFAFSGLLAYTVLGSFLAGITVIRDVDSGVAPLMNSTPLTAVEYVLGKMIGTWAVLGIALCWHIGMTAFTYEVVLSVGGEGVKGPFNPWNYISMGVIGAGPGIIAGAGLTFLATALIRRSLVVYAVPAVVLVVTLSHALVTPSSASWSVPAMLLDSSGIRWMFHTIFAQDQGIAHYNTAPIAFDALYITNRMIMIGVGCLSYGLAVPSIRRWMRPPDKLLFNGLSLSRLWRRKRQHDESGTVIQTRLPDMQTVPITAWKGALYIASLECREALRQPVYYLVVIVLMALVMEIVGETETGILGTSMYHTAGSISVSAFSMVSGLLCVLLLMYAVEASNRDRRANLAQVIHAMPVRSVSFVVGRFVTGIGLAICVLAVLVVVCLGMLQGQGPEFISVQPFLLVWGGLLVPSVVLWLAAMLLVSEISPNWVTTYAIGLLVFGVSIYATTRGWVDWSTNWLLWGSLRWSDMGAFVQDKNALLLNRSWVLVLSVLLLIAAAIWFRRRRSDKMRQVPLVWRRDRIYSTAGVAVLAVVVIGVMGYTQWSIQSGFQGKGVEQRDRAYWQQNMRTWKDYQPPEIIFKDIALVLDPPSRHMAVQGTYTLVNNSGYTMEVIPFTVPPAFELMNWEVFGESVEFQDRSGLHVIQLPDTMQDGDTLRLGFSYEAFIPKGMSRNGGPLSHFILPSGVLLSSSRGDFLPVPGFQEHRGRHPDNYIDPVDQDPRFVHLQHGEESKETTAFMSRIQVTAPCDIL